MKYRRRGFSTLLSGLRVLLFPDFGTRQAKSAECPEFLEQWVTWNGIRIHYIDEGKKDGLPLFFIHGLSCDATFWRFQIPAFSKDYRVIALDLPGFGKSDKPQDLVYDLPFFADAVKAVLDQTGVSRPVLIGHSMGYAVARQCLIQFPGYNRAICNVDGTYFRVPTQPVALEAWKTGMETFLEPFSGKYRAQALRAFITFSFYGKTPESLRAEITAKISSADVHAATSALREMGRPEQWKDQRFDLPALAVYAKTEQLAAGNEQYLRTLFPHLVYAEWDDVGHYVMLEKPKRFNNTLLDFLHTLRVTEQVRKRDIGQLSPR